MAVGQLALVDFAGQQWPVHFVFDKQGMSLRSSYEGLKGAACAKAERSR
jgi:hypothetical protein